MPGLVHVYVRHDVDTPQSSLVVQVIVPQGSDEEPVHAAPPQAGAGLSHERNLRVSTHAPQSPQPPLTVPHDCDEEPVQSAPPPYGAGFVHVRDCVQPLHALQSLQPPSTGEVQPCLGNPEQVAPPHDADGLSQERDCMLPIHAPQSLQPPLMGLFVFAHDALAVPGFVHVSVVQALPSLQSLAV